MLRIATLLVFVSTLFAQEPTRLELKPDELPGTATSWYGLYMAKQKIGWAEEQTLRTDDEQVVLGFVINMQMRAGGGVVRMRMTQRLVFDGKAPYRLFSGASTEDMGQGVAKTSVTRTDKGFEAKISAGGETRKVVVQLDFTLADAIGIEIWLRRGGLKAADRFTRRSLDLDELEVSSSTLVLRAIRQTLVRGVRQRVYLGSLSSPEDGELGTVRAASSGKMISFSFGGALEARREPEAIAKKLDAPVDMFAMLNLPLDKPLGDAATISELVLEASGSGVPTLRNGPRQTVTAGEDPTTCTLRLGAAHGTAIKATEAEVQKASKATHQYQSDDTRIVAMARKAVGDATDPRAKATRLVAFVDGFVTDEYGPEYSNAVAVMRAKRGDCSAHAMLFVALARAVGIPAREVSGYMYVGDADRALGGHAWCEVVLDGHWVEVDPTWNEMDINATHISFRGIGASMNMMKSGGNLSLRVLDIKRK